MLPSLVTPVVISEINVTETDFANVSNDRASDCLLVPQSCEKSTLISEARINNTTQELGMDS